MHGIRARDSNELSPWIRDVNWTYIRLSEDVLEVFRTPYVRSIYVTKFHFPLSWWAHSPISYHWFRGCLQKKASGMKWAQENASKALLRLHGGYPYHSVTPLLSPYFIGVWDFWKIIEGRRGGGEDQDFLGEIGGGREEKREVRAREGGGKDFFHYSLMDFGQ